MREAVRSGEYTMQELEDTETTKRKAKSRGQSLVEIALILPLLMALLMGAVDFGFILYAHVQVAAAAGEGARVGSLTLYAPGVKGATTADNDAYRLTQVKAAAARAMGRLNTAPPNFDVNNDVKITYDPTNPNPSSNYTRTGNQMIVEVRYRQRLFFNFLPGMVGDYFQVSSQARIRVQ
jgi:Flp pilus assembly protein TadG